MMLHSGQIADRLQQGEAEGCEDPFVVLPRPDLEAMKKSITSTIDIHLGRWFLKPFAFDVTQTALLLFSPSPGGRIRALGRSRNARQSVPIVSQLLMKN